MESISLSFTPSSNGDGEAIQTVQLVLVNAGGLHENLEAIKEIHTSETDGAKLYL
eukprot:m.118651 g.118651  ORF g.118651 m.118651 type:complete len:55 (+) comp15454_c0_seq5:114-278(+)